MKTKTKFLKWKEDGDIIALFPEMNHESGEANKGNIMSYMHIGQHGGASDELANDDRLEVATEAEYAPLLRELKMIGYDIEVI